MLPEELKKAREAAGLSPTQLAALIGMTERMIYRYEGGETPISQRTEMALRQALRDSRNGSFKKSRKLKRAS